MARETLKDFLRSGRYPGPNQNETGIVQYTLDSLVRESDRDSSGLAFEYNTGVPLVGFDAPDPDVGLVGNFLHYITSEAGNFYEFKRGNQETNAGNRGEVLQDQDKFLAVPPYVPQGTVEDSLLDQYSDSGYFSEPYPLEDIIDKVGGSRPPVPGGRAANDLIKGVANNDSDIVVRSSVSALKKKNRFNMDEDQFLPEASAGTASGIDTKDNFQFVREESDFYTSFERLKDAGASQILKASGYDLSDNPENSLDYISNLEKMILDNVEGPSYETKVQMPGNVSGQEVDKISINRLKGINATGVPTLENGSSVRSGKGVFVPVIPGSSNGGSFGVTYNHMIRFEDNTKTHRVKTALRMITLFTLIESLYKEVIDNLSKEDQTLIKDDIQKIAVSPNNVNAGALALGLSRKSNKFIAKNFLFDNFLTPTDYPYSDCFYRGVKVMFGSDPKNVNKVLENIDNVYNSPGFLLAISNVAIKKTFLFSDKIQRLQAIKEGSGVGFARQEAIKDIIAEFGSVAKIANIFAIIGEKSLHFTNASQEGSTSIRLGNARDVDSLDNIPGNRVGKSRKKKSGGRLASGDLGSETTLSWEQSDVPSAYLLPLNIMRAAADLNNTYTRENPARGMLGSRMVRNTYTGLDTDGTSARIPARVVKILEDKLEAEYVPFYIQDLRTNEIISFHAFLGDLTDSIAPSYSSTAGYGRLDPIQTYQTTTRSINLSFTLYSTNREDFDDMWYKINKFVTLLYPQWTQGSIVQSGNPDTGPTIEGYDGARFVQPFTQTIGASPIVRLRVGDVIKSNYSRFALARTFGIGDQGVKAQPIGYGGSLTASAFGEYMRKWRDLGLTIFATIFGSPQGLLQLGSDAANAASSEKPGVNIGLNAGFDLASSALSDILINGFVNPLLTLQTMQRLRDPNVFDTEGFNGTGKNIMFVYINPNMIDGYQSTDGIKIFTTKRLLGKVIDTVKDETGNKKVYKVVIADRSDESIHKKEIFVRHEDIWNDPSETFTKSVAGILYLAAAGDFVSLVDTLSGLLSKSGGDLAFLTDAASDIAQLFLENQESAFMRPELNPYVRAFHTTRGRGLAGVIKGVNFNWLDEQFPWETDFNARAPMGCKISFGFDVIHDIPPGLDHSGYNRAPLYNVGEIMRNVSGDVYEDKFSKAERIFRQGGSNSLSPGKTAKKTGR